MESQAEAGQEDVVENAARVANLVVHLEVAYDVIDELARDPNKLEDAIYSLSRLATKVLNDVAEAYERTKNEDLSRAMNMLESWLSRANKFINYIRGLSDERDRIREIKRFCALTISPSGYAYKIEKMLRGE